MYIGPYDLSHSKRSDTLGSIRLYLDKLEDRLQRKYNDYTKVYRISSEEVYAGIALVGLGAGLIFLSATLGALIGALFGEILDHTPYLNTAISETLNTMFHTNYFTGNLDKLGATIGFVGGFFKDYLKIRIIKKKIK
jgi:CTP-dependent riboflavin kinase